MKIGNQTYKNLKPSNQKGDTLDKKQKGLGYVDGDWLFQQMLLEIKTYDAFTEDMYHSPKVVVHVRNSSKPYAFHVILAKCAAFCTYKSEDDGVTPVYTSALDGITDWSLCNHVWVNPNDLAEDEQITLSRYIRNQYFTNNGLHLYSDNSTGVVSGREGIIYTYLNAAISSLDLRGIYQQFSRFCHDPYVPVGSVQRLANQGITVKATSGAPMPQDSRFQVASALNTKFIIPIWAQIDELFTRDFGLKDDVVFIRKVGATSQGDAAFMEQGQAAKSWVDFAMGQSSSGIRGWDNSRPAWLSTSEQSQQNSAAQGIAKGVQDTYNQAFKIGKGAYDNTIYPFWAVRYNRDLGRSEPTSRSYNNPAPKQPFSETRPWDVFESFRTNPRGGAFIAPYVFIQNRLMASPPDYYREYVGYLKKFIEWESKNEG